MWPRFAQVRGNLRYLFYATGELHLQIGMVLPHPGRKLKALGGRQGRDVAHDHIDRERGFVQSKEGFVCACCFDHRVAAVAEVVRDRVSGQDVGIDDQDKLAWLLTGGIAVH